MKNITTVFGAPGCGKTTRLIEILKDLLTKYAPEEIAYVSFTRKGAYEGRDRAREAFPMYAEKQFKYFRTIHSLAFLALEYRKVDVINWKHYKTFSKSMGMSFTGYYTEDFNHSDDQYLFYYFLSQNNPEKAKKLLDKIDEWKAKFVAHNYEKYKRWANVKDFDDMLLEFVRSNTPAPVKVAIIDEAQDLTTLQWQACEVAFRNCDKVFVGGDDDQAIYEWSGADVDRFLHLPGDREVLDKSYRLQSEILEYSKRFSRLIKNRVEKNFKPLDVGGSVEFHVNFDTLELTDEESWYFLSRNNMFLPQYSNWLSDMGHRFTIKNKRSVPKEFVDAVNMYELVRAGKVDPTREQQLLMRRWMKSHEEVGKPWFDAFNLSEKNLEYYRRVVKKSQEKKHYNLHVSTIHGVKGGEADNVVLMLDMTKNVRENADQNPDSELRCLYVACTRAKKKLHLVHSKGRSGYEDVFPVV